MLRQYLEYIGKYLNDSKIQFLIKIFFFPVYLFFLYLNGTATLFFIFPVFLTLFFRINHGHLCFILLICSFFDPVEFWRVSFDYGSYNLLAYVKGIVSVEYYWWIHSISFLAAILFSYFFVSAASYFTKSKKVSLALILFVFIILSHLTVQKINFAPNELNPIGMVALLSLMFLNKKIWILAIAVHHKNHLSLSFKKFLENITFFTPYARESFVTDGYRTQDFKVFLKGMLLCIVYIGFKYFGISLIQPENLLNNRVCFQNLPIETYLNLDLSLWFKWYCFIKTTLIYRVFENLLVDAFLLLVPAYLIGYDYNFVMKNIFKSTSYADFIGRLMYYFSYVVRTFFIEDFKKIINPLHQDKAVLRNFSIFIGVLVGSIGYQWARDLNYSMVYGSLANLNFFKNSFLYFFILSMLITFNFKLSKSVKINVVVWILITLLIGVLNIYYNTEPIFLKFKLIFDLLGLKL